MSVNLLLRHTLAQADGPGLGESVLILVGHVQAMIQKRHPAKTTKTVSTLGKMLVSR